MPIDQQIQEIFMEEPYDGLRVLDRLISIRPSLTLDAVEAVYWGGKTYSKYRERILADFENGIIEDDIVRRICDLSWVKESIEKGDMEHSYYWIKEELYSIRPENLLLRAVLYSKTLEFYEGEISQDELSVLYQNLKPLLFDPERASRPFRWFKENCPNLGRAVGLAFGYINDQLDRRGLSAEIKQKMENDLSKENYGRKMEYWILGGDIYGDQLIMIIQHIMKNESAGVWSPFV